MSNHKNLRFIRLTILTVSALLANISSVLGSDPGGVLPWITNGITRQILAAGQGHVLAVRADGTVWVLGDSSQGQTGLGVYPRSTSVNPFRKDPVLLTNVSGAVAVAAGQNHSLVLDQNSNVWVFGSGDSGQLGLGNTKDQPFPVTNNLFSVVAIQAGANHSMAVLADGRILGWGANNSRQLGANSTLSILTTPTVVYNYNHTLDNVQFVAAACGARHTLGLTRDGKVFAWGDNSFGELGVGASSVTINQPTNVVTAGGSPLDQIAAIAAGQDFSMALRTNGTAGTIYVWGNGAAYRLGLGDTKNKYLPTAIPNHDNIWQIRAGSQQGYALDTASNLLVWGTSAAPPYGLGLGLPPNTQKTTPFTNNYVSNLVALSDASKLYNDHHVSVALDLSSRLHWWGHYSVTVDTTTHVWPAAGSPMTPTTPDYDLDMGYSSASTSRPPSPLAYVRGTLTNADLASFVLPLDFQKGIQLDNLGEAGAIGLLPFIKDPNHGYDYGYHFNPTNSVANGQTDTSLRIKYKGPIAAFGSRVGGAPLYTDQSYRFIIYAGTPTLTNTFGQVDAYQDALQIDVYSKAPPNFPFVGTFAIPIRYYLDGQNTWDSFLTNGLTASVNKFGLKTTLSPRSAPFAYGVTNNGVLELAHNASDEATNYIFVVKMKGRNGSGWVAESGDTPPLPVWQPLYSFEFVPALPWTVRFLSQIQFQKEPLPPFYDGKSLSELLTNSWNVTNAVSLPNPISSYTTVDASPELHSHPILDSFVDQMKHDPIALARFVQNEIELTDAIDCMATNQITAGRLNLGGINRGALGTFLERQGSPTEQCALLIYLLRQAGFPAVYAFPPTDGIKMLDTRVSKLLRIQIAGALDPNSLTINSHSLIAMNYPWVAAYINDHWVHLFPWIKDTEIIEGPNVYDFLPDRYDNAMKWVMGYLTTDPAIVGLGETNDPPEVLFPRYVQQELNKRAPGLSFDELGIRAVNRKLALNSFDEFPRPTWVAGETKFAENLSEDTLTNSTFRTWNPNVLAPAIFNTVRVTLSHNASPGVVVDSGDLRCCDIHDRTFLVFHDKAGGPARLNLSLAPFRTNIVAVSSFTNDATLLNKQLITTNLPAAATDITIDISNTWWRSTGESLPNLHKQSFLKRGDLAAICLNFGRVSKEMLEPLASTIWNEERKIKVVSGYKNNLPSDRYHGPLAYLMGMCYWEKVNRFMPVNQRLHGFSTLAMAGMGTAKLRASRNQYDGSINWENNKPIYVQPALDMVGTSLSIAELPTSRPDSGENINFANDAFSILNIVDGSAKEHDTLNKFFGQTAAISTVRLLQLGQNQDPKSGMQGVINVNQNNLFAMGELPVPIIPGSTTKFPMRRSYGSMWSQIEEAVAASPESQVLCTRGKLGILLGPTTQYNGVGVLIIDRRGSYAALITEAGNGGFSSVLPSDTFQAVNLDNDSLVVNSSADYYVTTTPINADNMPLPSDSVPFYFTSRVSDFATADHFTYTTYDNNYANQIANNFNLGQGNWQPNILYANAVATIESFGNLGWQSDGLKQRGSAIADPVHCITGEFYVDTVDLSLVGPFPLEIRRNYSSLNLADNSFGIGWKLAFTPYLSVVTNTAVIYAAEADGSVLAYESTNNSNFYYPIPYRNPGLSNNRNAGIGSTANLFNNRLERQVTSTDTNYFLYGASGDVRTYKVQSYSIPTIIERSRPYLQQWTDSCGNYLLFSYGSDTNETDFGELHRVDSSNGGFVQFRYDVYGHIVEAFTGDGRTLKYDYDQYGDLTKVTLPDASEISYEYTHTNQNARVNGALKPQIASLHLLAKELKPDGRVLLNVYDSTNRVIIQASTVGPDLNLVTNATFQYHNDFVLTNSFTNGITGWTDIRDVFGNVTHYDYSKSLITNIVDPLGLKLEQVWYPADNIPPGGYPHSIWKQKDRRGLLTEFKYDSFGNVTNMITTGSLTGEHPTGSEVSSYQAAYNTKNLPIVLVDAIGNSNVIHYDATFPFLPDQVTSYKVGIPINTTRSSYTSVTSEIHNGNTNYTIFACGLPQRQVRAWGSPDAATNDVYYDGRGFPTNGIRYTGTSDPAITNLLFFNGRGELFQTINGAGHRHHYDYDLLGRIESEEVFVPGQNAPISWNNSYYNHNGEITWSDGPRFDPEDYIWRDYDGAGRKIVEARWRSRAKSDGSGVQAVPGDGLYSISSFQYDPFGNLTNSVDPLGNYQVMTYDAIGQMTQQVFYAGDGTALSAKTLGYEPGGKVAAATNSLGTFTLTSYTQTGLPYAQVNPDGSTNGWLYYLDGRVRKEFMPNGNYWETIYDDAHRRVTKLFRDPKGTCLLSTTNIFDRRGNVITNVNAEGAAFFTTYDGLDRPKITGGPATINGVSAQQISRIYYDGSGIATTNENNLGRRTVSLFDALQRPVSVEIRDTLNNNTLVWKQTTSYTSNHNSVTVTAGTGSGAVKHTTFTDTFGRSVLEQSFPSTTITNFTRSTYDVAGNLLESRDELDQPTSFAYDGLNRLKSRTLPDRATVNFTYNSEGSLLSMAMPAGLTWSATYNSTNQKTFEKLTGPAGVTRQFTNVYFGPGPLAGLLQQSIDLGRLVTNTYAYDVFLRVITNSALGKQADFPEHTLLTTFQYDRQGRVTNLVQSSGVNPTTRIARKYDGYGQITSEQVYLDGALQSSFNQVWDAAGRRTSLKSADAEFDYLYRADNRMSRVTAFNSQCDFNYDNAGLLVSRSSPWRTTTIQERDLRGRPLNIGHSTPVTGTTFVEKLAWRDNSTLSSYTATRNVDTLDSYPTPWDDRRSFGYNSRGQLLSESLGLSPSTSATTDYTFDPNLLGVRMSEVFRGDLANNWNAAGAPAPDGFGRITGESINQSTISVQAYGTSAGAAEVHGTLDGNSLTAVAYNPLSTDGRWSANLSLSPGGHTLSMGSSARSGSYAPPNASSAFSATGTEGIVDSYDDAGYVVSRTLAGGTQTLKWDAAGRLVSIAFRDVKNNGYDWSAIYDGLGRRLRTTHSRFTIAKIFVDSPQITDSFFDPQVEFQEVGVSLNGTRSWKIFGPDLDGNYGSSQGLGGLEATYWQPGQKISGTIQDYFGNIPATLELQQLDIQYIDWVVKWAGTPVRSYGPVLGYSPPIFSSGVSLADASVWRGKRIEPTGFYWLGARYYDPVGGRFLSPDPLGHSASMDLYSFCGGDPLNRFDPDGRLMKGAAYALGDLMDIPNQLINGPTGPSYHSMLNGSAWSEAGYFGGRVLGEATFQFALFTATGGMGAIAEAAAARSAFGIGMESFAARSLVSLESRAAVQGVLSAELRGGASLALEAEAQTAGLAASAESPLYAMGESGQMEFGFAQNVAPAPAITAVQPIIQETQPIVANATQLELDLAPAPRFNTLANVRDQVDKQAQWAIDRALAKGYTGAKAGIYADKLFNRANGFLNRELVSSGSPFRVDVQPSRNASGGIATYGDAGSRRLDAAITDISGGTTYSGYDITVSTRRWNSGRVNNDYITRFGIQENYVREFNPFGPR